MDLHNLLSEKLWKQIDEKSVTILESKNENNDARLESVLVENLPEKIILISFEPDVNERSFNKFLNTEDKRINKICDGILIHYREDSTIDVLICELKSTNPKEVTYETQLVNSKLFLDYLICLFNCFENNGIDPSKLEINKCNLILFYLPKPATPRLKMRNSVKEEISTTKQPTKEKMKMRNYPQYFKVKIPCQYKKLQSFDWDMLFNL